MTETFAPARFSFPLPPTSTRVRTAWISDVHLGTRASGAARLLDFLREYDFQMLYIVGDLIDTWQMRRSRYWPQQHNDVIQKILRKARKGTRVFYIPGNHDEMISSFYGAYGDITIQKHAIHQKADGRRILVIDGHELDTGGAKREVAGFPRRCRLPVPALTQSVNQFLPSALRPGLLVAERLRQTTGQRCG